MGCSALQFLNKDQSNKLASRFSELIKQVHSKLRVRDKFAQEGFVPKPLLFKPVLNACSKVKETSNFKALIEQEADIITRFKTDMSRLMFETAELELANAANDALTFSVGFTKKLVLYQRTVSNMDGSGDPSLIEQVVRKLFYEEEFKHLRFRVDDKEIDVILPNNPDPSNTSSELNDLDKVAQLKNEVRPLLRNILLASMKEYENRIVHSKKMDEIFEIFEEERFTNAAEDMITELEHIDEPIPAKFMHEVIKNVDDHLKKNFDKLVKSNRGASVASASLKKKPEKTRRRVGGTQKEKHNGTKKGKKNSQSNKERQKKKQGKGENS